MTKEVGVDPFPQPGVGGRGADNLPGPFAADLEEAVVWARAGKPVFMGNMALDLSYSCLDIPWK
jgi:hypothetical protein